MVPREVMAVRDDRRTMDDRWSRRDVIRGLAAGAASAPVVLGAPSRSWAQEPPAEVRTNLDQFTAVPRGPHAIPGPWPGRVVQVTDPACLTGGAIDAPTVAAMLRTALESLAGMDPGELFGRLFTANDLVGIKVNPVGPPLIAVHTEVVDALIGWLTAGGLPRDHIVIWDRFDTMLAEAGFVPERFPGVRIEGLQTSGDDDRPAVDGQGNHVSAERFDPEFYYLAEGVPGRGVPGYDSDEAYLEQHVFAGDRSYFGKLVTRELTRIINVGPFKNTGNGVSMATKNLGYGVMCNTGRLHRPLFFRVNTEVLAAPPVRDKLVLNVLDAIYAQYEGGPMLSEAHVVEHHALYVATDPIALDTIGHGQMVAMRKARGVPVNEHPRYTSYLHDAEALGLGVADPARIEHVVLP